MVFSLQSTKDTQYIIFFNGIFIAEYKRYTIYYFFRPKEAPVAEQKVLIR